MRPCESYGQESVVEDTQTATGQDQMGGDRVIDVSQGAPGCLEEYWSAVAYLKYAGKTHNSER